jgi:hypothetical protein
MDIANIDRTRAALRRGFKIVECENALVGVNDEDRTVRPADDELFNSSRLPARTKFVVGLSMGDMGDPTFLLRSHRPVTA